MKRLGFVKLSRYGLVLTPEDRIMTLRPEILDDGMGGRIVGWLDRDLAAAELAKWEPMKPAPAKAVAARVASVPATPRVMVIPPPIPAVLVPPMPVAPVVEPEEDEWEWTIALARARAAVEDVAVAAQVAATPAPMPRRTRQDTVPPPPVSEPIGPKKPQPLPAVTLAAPVRDPLDSDDWPKTEPLGAIDYEDYTNPTSEIVRVVQRANMMRSAIPAPKATPPSQPVARPFERAKSPSTIIPVPKLPRISETHQALEPVVSPRRSPKGTPPPVPMIKPLGVVPPPPIRTGDDQTKPGIALPPPAALLTLPRIPGLKRPATRG